MITSPEQARRIDRLARRAHLFHRYAHHPLCDAYAGEVIRVGGRTRLCRGCACAAGGALAGISVGLTTRVPTSLLVAWIGVAVLLGVASLSRRSRDVSSHARRRSSKMLTRAAPAALLTWAVAAGLRGGGATGWLVAGVAAAVAAGTVAAYRRRRPDRTACDACPERSTGTICSGLRPIARREAAFARAAGRILAARHRPGA